MILLVMADYICYLIDIDSSRERIYGLYSPFYVLVCFLTRCRLLPSDHASVMTYCHCFDMSKGNSRLMSEDALA